MSMLRFSSRIYPPKPDTDAAWYEYVVTAQCDRCGATQEFDSYYETYNGVQRLTRAEAQRAADEMLAECKADPTLEGYFKPCCCR
jgi:hypothetical protein